MRGGREREGGRGREAMAAATKKLDEEEEEKRSAAAAVAAHVCLSIANKSVRVWRARRRTGVPPHPPPVMKWPLDFQPAVSSHSILTLGVQEALWHFMPAAAALQGMQPRWRFRLPASVRPSVRSIILNAVAERPRPTERPSTTALRDPYPRRAIARTKLLRCRANSPPPPSLR